MTFDIFLLAFDDGEPCAMDLAAAREILEPLTIERDGAFRVIEFGNGSADVYGPGDDSDSASSIMFNHVSGTDPWSVIFELMQACQLALMAPDSATCVSSDAAGENLPVELAEWTVVSSGDELLGVVTGDSDTAVHREPAWRDRADYILRVDLEPHDMAGRFEQLWVRRVGEDSYELCCIPFFVYGAALGDLVTTGGALGGFQVVEPSGHRCIRVAMKKRPVDDGTHVLLHGALHDAGATCEFHNAGYVAVDVASDEDSARIIAALAPFIDSGDAVWEWADA